MKTATLALTMLAAAAVACGPKADTANPDDATASDAKDAPTDEAAADGAEEPVDEAAGDAEEAPAEEAAPEEAAE
jgi:hypothetical protein